jgi:mercuric ion binding protein
MTKHLTIVSLILALTLGVTLTVFHAGGSPAAASESVVGAKTVTLAVQNMYCAACPHTVKASLEAVPGVSKVSVSFNDKTATVTYNPAQTTLAALTQATTNAGYPSALKN